MQVDDIDLRNGLAMPLEDPSAREIGVVVARLDNTLEEAPAPVIDHEILPAVERDAIGRFRQASVVVCGEHIAAPVDPAPALEQREHRPYEALVIGLDRRSRGVVTNGFERHLLGRANALVVVVHE
ncbi:hypothetical protein D3C81_1276270 [compost metagenome]